MRGKEHRLLLRASMSTWCLSQDNEKILCVGRFVLFKSLMVECSIKNFN